MKRIPIISAVFMTLGASVSAFASERDVDIIVLSDVKDQTFAVDFDALIVSALPVEYVLEFSGEIVPDYVPAVLGAEKEAKAEEVFHPPKG